MISASDRTLIESVPVEWGNYATRPLCPSVSFFFYLPLALYSLLPLAVSNAPNDPTRLKAFKNAAAAEVEAEAA